MYSLSSVTVIVDLFAAKVIMPFNFIVLFFLFELTNI